MRHLTCLLGFCVVALMSPAASADLFTDDFSDGLRSAYWTVTQTTSGLYSVATNNDVQLARNSSPVTSFQNVTISLNLAAAIGQSSIAGNFSTQIDFSSANLTGSGLDQAELHTFYNGGSDQTLGPGFFDVRSNDLAPGTNQPEQNVHVWNYDGQLHGYTPLSSDSGTFAISRTGSTLSGYFDGMLMFSETNSMPLTGITFVLQNNVGNDPISITFGNFSLSTTSAVPEPSPIARVFVGMAGLAGAHLGRRRVTRKSGR